MGVSKAGVAAAVSQYKTAVKFVTLVDSSYHDFSAAVMRCDRLFLTGLLLKLESFLSHPPAVLATKFL